MVAFGEVNNLIGLRTQDTNYCDDGFIAERYNRGIFYTGVSNLLLTRYFYSQVRSIFMIKHNQIFIKIMKACRRLFGGDFFVLLPDTLDVARMFIMCTEVHKRRQQSDGTDCENAEKLSAFGC